MKKGVFFLIAALLLAAFFFQKKTLVPIEVPSPATEATEAKTNSATSSPSASSIATSEDKNKLILLEAILKSRNDNDPRLDTEFKTLSAGAAALLREKYQSLPLEQRNERGTIAFLLGRNIQNEADLEFFRGVVQEKACRSLKDCNEDPQRAEGDTLHSEAGSDVTLAYPQLVALKSLERILAAGEKHPLFQKTLETVQAASQSPIDKVSHLAKSLEDRFNR